MIAHLTPKVGLATSLDGLALSGSELAYERGLLAGQDFVSLLFAPPPDSIVAPNALAMEMERRVKALSDARWQGMDKMPLAERSPEFQDLRWDFLGFCAAVMSALQVSSCRHARSKLDPARGESGRPARDRVATESA